MKKLLAGNNLPFFQPNTGRSAWFKLTTPISISHGNAQVEIQSVKIKGVGLLNFRGEIMKPNPKPFQRNLPHLGFTPEGRWINLYSSDNPTGGMTLDRGITEFSISTNLYLQGCPCQVPIFLYQYDEAN